MTSNLPELIRNDRDLDDFWRALMGPLGFGRRRLWLVMIEPDGQPIKQIMQVDDPPVGFDDGDAENLMIAFGEPVREAMPDGALAILFTRPGRGRLTTDDRRLALRITQAAARMGVPLRPIFFANDEQLCVFAADDLLLESSTR